MDKIRKEFIIRNAAIRKALDAFLDSNWEACANAKSPLAITIKNEKAKRSDAQNARYFGYILAQIAEQAFVNGKQYDKDTWHEYYKRKFIGIVELPDGNTRAKSSANLPVDEFKEFSDKVEADAATEHGVLFYEREM